ncbi:MAG: response regulator transcription factor [Scytonematopsis contorta HA4267-MV1]|jgi:DNA-binding response OmpR family regulator|nr:response regulator transcription factor [Scytonematopsis contorta HA4267-MV1]
MRILVVEDDVQIADMLTEALTNRQYIVDAAYDGENAWHWIENHEYDLMLLDITLPKMNGLLLCQKLRQNKCTIPVLMLTARDTIADKIIGLDAGADAYLVKPFNLDELMAQIRALLRRGGIGAKKNLAWGNLCLNPNTYEVYYSQELLRLTPKEYAVLELLVTNGRRVLSRPGIIERLWSVDESPTEEAVKTHIRTLRQKLRLAGAPSDFIETLHGLGYRMKKVD